MNKINVSMNEILTNTLKRTKGNAFTTNVADYDVFISVSPATKKKSTIVRFNYRYKWIKNFNCVTLSRIGNNLFFIFSEIDENGTAYAVSKKGGSISTSVSGINADKLADFKGFYKFNEYDWTKSKKPIFYISLEDKINE